MPAQAMEITCLCLCWKSGMGKTFPLFVKIPSTPGKIYSRFVKGSSSSMGKELREGRAAWEKMGERECERLSGSERALRTIREGVQTQ